MEDAELIEHAKRGDQDAYGALVERYQEFAVRAAYLVTGDLAEAEDAAQQAFVKAYYARDRLRPGAPFRPWLLRIVVNEARNLRTAAQRRSDREVRAARHFPAEAAAPSAEDTVLANEEQRALLATLLRLRESDRLVIGYRYLLDLSEAEMAQTLGLARGTVKSRLSRAIGRLRESFDRLYPLGVLVPEVGTPVEEGLGRLATPPPSQPPGAFHDAILGHIAADGRGADRPPGNRHAPVVGPLALLAVATVLLTSAVLVAVKLLQPPSPPPAAVASQKIVVYGADLTDGERQEVAELLGADGALETDTVSADELAGSLQTAGLPVAAADAISSAMLTCPEPGRGLRVGVRHITRLPAAAYAHALLTARPVHASLVIAAPSGRPVTGEAALVGVLKIVTHCEGASDVDPARVQLAYEQLQATVALAGESDDLARAAAVLVNAARAVITGQARDEAALGATLDHAAAAEGLTLSVAQRSGVLSTLTKLRDLDYGAYAQTYQFQWIGPQDIEVLPLDGGRR